MSLACNGRYTTRIHFLGIGGIGMSGLALLMAGKGCRVSGCDLGVSRPIARWLEKAGVRLHAGHSPRHLCGAAPDLVVRTPAIRDDNPELAAAGRRGIRIASRGEALADFANSCETIAVCGSHGKTTTSCFTAMLLRAMRLPAAFPGWCIGGWTDSLGSVARSPAEGAPFVIEADESDGTLALYKPLVTVVTSIEHDHLEHFDSFDALVECFRKVCTQTRKAVVFCADDPVASKVAGECGVATIGYGFSADCRLRARNVVCDGESSTFDLDYDGRVFRSLRLGVPGRHNVLNALGAIGACLALGVPMEEAVARIGALDSLPHRRFEKFTSPAGFEVVSDYSHHPTEIRALIETAKGQGKPIVAFFQPHRYSRTKALLEEFAHAFDALGAGDRLVLLPVYPAFEDPLEGGTTVDLYARMRQLNAEGALGIVPELAQSVEEAAGFIRAGGAGTGGLVLVIGAGDIISLAETLRRMRGTLPVAPAPIRVSLGVPAFADNLVEVRDEDALASALREGVAPVRMLGQGTNLLPSPLGVRGTVVRLLADALEIREGCDCVEVVAECGVPGARLLAELARLGLSGLEFMMGIPGTLGGWLAMNAGTRNGEIGDAVEEVVAYDARGRRHVAARSQCGFSYRSCRWLADKMAFSATLRQRRDDPEAVFSRMREAFGKRFDFGGFRTAGSAFKNPPGAFAGALLEAAQCKGLRIGGAHVLERHANIVAADKDATASDVLALLETMRGRVARQSGVNLELEIRKW